LYSPCFTEKFGGAENLLDALTQYKTLEFFRLGLNQGAILPGQSMEYNSKNSANIAICFGYR